jgi:hypothetical protein
MNASQLRAAIGWKRLVGAVAIGSMADAAAVIAARAGRERDRQQQHHRRAPC